MSNKNNKAKEQEVPFDFITENKALNYTITVRDLDLLELKQRNLKLKEMPISVVVARINFGHLVRKVSATVVVVGAVILLLFIEK